MPLPQQRASNTTGTLEESLPLAWGRETALSHCWVDTAVTTFEEGATWPYHGTAVVDRDVATFPSDSGALESSDLGAEATALLGEVTSSNDRQARVVGKPTINNIRTAKYRLKPSSDAKRDLCEMREAIRFTKNEAIRLLNEVHSQAHPFLATSYTLFAKLCNSTSDFVLANPFLAKCPSLSRRRGVSEAIAARKGILTKNPGLSVPNMKPVTAEQDRTQGFLVKFAPSSGGIVPAFDRTSGVDHIQHLQLSLAPRKLSAPAIPICLRGQAQRQKLLGACEQRQLSTGLTLLFHRQRQSFRMATVTSMTAWCSAPPGLTSSLSFRSPPSNRRSDRNCQPVLQTAFQTIC